MPLKTDKPCNTISVVESSIKKEVPSIFIATIDITRRYAYVVGGDKYKKNGSRVPKGTPYYTDLDSAYKEFSKLRGDQIMLVNRLKEKRDKAARRK